MRLSTLVLAIGMALGAQAQAAETQPHADHSAAQRPGEGGYRDR